IDYREAQQLVLQQARSFGTETVPLVQAGGRVLSGVIRADRDYPPLPRATMDGFALRFSDLEQGIRRFAIIETIMAGQMAARTIHSGECFKIMTGAAVPSSADGVIQREQPEEGQGFPRLLSAPAAPPFPWRPFQNIARQGEDLLAGGTVIDRAMVCEAAVIGLLATLG